MPRSIVSKSSPHNHARTVNTVPTEHATESHSLDERGAQQIIYPSRSIAVRLIARVPTAHSPLLPFGPVCLGRVARWITARVNTFPGQGGATISRRWPVFSSKLSLQRTVDQHRFPPRATGRIEEAMLDSDERSVVPYKSSANCDAFVSFFFWKTTS